MSLYDPGHSADIAPRTFGDCVLALTWISTSPWWMEIGHSLNDIGASFLLWGSVAVLAVRLYGLVRDVLRGRARRSDEDED